MSRVKADLNGYLTNTWLIPLTEAPVKSPLRFCEGFLCPCCFAHQQRNQILDITGEPYVCCGGTCPCATQHCDSREPWLCLETCCCTSPAILANRFLLQTRFSIQNDPCDETILEITAFINMLAQCAEICVDRETAEHLEHIVHCINACVCSCLLTQQHLELKSIQQSEAGMAYQGPPPQVLAVLPPQQQSMCQAAQALRFQAGAPPPTNPMAQVPAQQAMPGVPPQQAMPAPAMPAQQAMPAPAMPAQEAMRAPLAAQGRTVMLTVPGGVGPGGLITFNHPDTGAPQQAAVPAGLRPGQQFTAMC